MILLDFPYFPPTLDDIWIGGGEQTPSFLLVSTRGYSLVARRAGAAQDRQTMNRVFLKK